MPGKASSDRYPAANSLDLSAGELTQEPFFTTRLYDRSWSLFTVFRHGRPTEMKIAVASDHAGFSLKEEIAEVEGPGTRN